MASCRACGYDPVEERGRFRFLLWLITGALVAALIAGWVGDWLYLGFVFGALWITAPFDWTSERWWKLRAERTDGSNADA